MAVGKTIVFPELISQSNQPTAPGFRSWSRPPVVVWFASGAEVFGSVALKSTSTSNKESYIFIIIHFN